MNDDPDSDPGDNPDSDTGDIEEVDYDLLPPPPKLKCFKQGIEALEDFVEYGGYVEQATSVGKVMPNLAGTSASNYTQTTIDIIICCVIELHQLSH